MFGPVPEKCMPFVQTRPGDRPVTDVYGVGPLAAENLKVYGITKAWQLIVLVLSNLDEAVDNLIHFGVPSYSAKSCAATLVACWNYHMS